MMKKYFTLLLSGCLLAACANTATNQSNTTQPTFGEAQLFGIWDCEIEAQRDYIHTFAPKSIMFEQRDDLPAHPWMGYIENKKDATQDEIAIGYREFFTGWWNIKPTSKIPNSVQVSMTIQYAGVKRLHQADEIKNKQTRQEDAEHVKYIEERSEKRNFKSLDFFVKPLNDGRIRMTDGESVMLCSKRAEKESESKSKS